MIPIVNTFGGKNGEGENVLMTALVNASQAYGEKDNDKIYHFLNTTPKASLVVKLNDEIVRLGYKIIKDERKTT